MPETLQDSVNYASTLIRYMDPTAGIGNEPAITAANTIMQTIRNPPFTWRLNRATTTFQTAIGQQDYLLSMTGSPIPSLGFLETATVQPCGIIADVEISNNVATISCYNTFVSGAPFSISGLTTTGLNVSGVIISAQQDTFTFATVLGDMAVTPDVGVAISGKIYQLKNVDNSEALSESSDLQRPDSIAVQYDTGESEITFRFMGVPDNTYNVVLNYQVAPFTFSNLTDEWQQDTSGLSYDFAHIYNTFFVGYCMEYAQDSRADKWLARGAAALIGKSEGLTEMEKQIFMQAYMPGFVTPQIAQTRLQQGNSARAQG